jgi:hypothetical protein
MKKMILIFVVFMTNGVLLEAQWIQTNGPFGGQINSIVVNGTNIFAGAYYGGVFLSGDNGENWMERNSGLTSTKVTPLAFKGARLFAGTISHGIWKRPLDEIFASVGTNPELNGISIYPNPTTGHFAIETSNSSNKFISICDIGGRTLQCFSTRINKMQIDITDYLTGRYLLKVRTDQDCNTIKILNK